MGYGNNIPGFPLPQQRIEVGRNLGDVRQGDHIIVVAGLAVALDTSRPVEDTSVRPKVAKPLHNPPENGSGAVWARLAGRESQASSQTDGEITEQPNRARVALDVFLGRKKSPAIRRLFVPGRGAGRHITAQKVLDIVQTHQPISALKVADRLGIGRKDKLQRDRVSRVLRMLREADVIQRGEGRFAAYTIAVNPVAAGVGP